MPTRGHSHGSDCSFQDFKDSFREPPPKLKMAKGKKGPGPFTSEDDEEPSQPPPETDIPTLPLIPALGIEEPPIGVVIDEESPQFGAALDRRIAQLQFLRDESPIIDNPLGLIDIAPRVDLPLGDQPSSRNTETRAILTNLRPSSPSSPVPSDDDSSISSSKISSRFDNGGNPRKIFSSESSITTMKGRKNSNNNNNNKIGTTPRQAKFWDKDSSSSDEEQDIKYSKKKPCNKMVKRIHYQRNSTVLISEIGKYVIDINTPDIFHRLRMLHSVLSTTGLLTLIEGHRGDQPSSRNTETRAILTNLRPSSSSSPMPSDDESSFSSSKNSSRLNKGGNPRKNFSSESSITTMKGRKDSNDNKNDKIGSTPRQSEFWDKDSSSSDEEQEIQYSKKKPCNKMVKRIHYQRNSTVLLSEIGKYVIDINTPDKFHRLRMLHSVLSTTGLLTLIEGHRTEPIMTEENTHGFKTRKIILVPRVEYEDEKSIDSMSSEPIVERVVLDKIQFRCVTFDFL